MSSVIVPLVKCKTKDLSDVNNYRAIAISNTISKVFESVVLNDVTTVAAGDELQYGFKHGLSTGLCTNVLKTTVNYYTTRGSYIFCCFIDFSKAFDRVNYWRLFSKLLSDGVYSELIRLLSYWYSHQMMCVRWHSKVSGSFMVSNGTRQGSILSPYFFARYIRDVLNTLVMERVGCNIGGQFINVPAYADDFVIITPSWRAMQHLLDVLSVETLAIDMNCNPQKTVCMVFQPKRRDRIIAGVFPSFKIGGHDIQFVAEFRHLGHVINNSLTDDDDINREIRNMVMRTNILMRRFGNCSVSVKWTWFKCYCLCMYDVGLCTVFIHSFILLKSGDEAHRKKKRSAYSIQYRHICYRPISFLYFFLCFYVCVCMCVGVCLMLCLWASSSDFNKMNEYCAFAKTD